MKRRTCYKCEKRKAISKFGRNKMYLTLGRRDGINIYCKKCRSDDVAERRAKAKAAKPPKVVQQEEIIEVINPQIAVLEAVQIGCHSRELISEHTKLGMDEVVDALAHWWDQDRVQIVNRDSKKAYVIKKAA